MQFKAEVTTEVSAQDISYAFIGVIESGYDWFHLFEPADKTGSAPGGPWYADPKFFERDDFKITVTAENPEEGDDTIKKEVGPAEIQAGLALMAKDYASDLADLVSESGADANTYDVFMQCVVFGDVPYG